MHHSMKRTWHRPKGEGYLSPVAEVVEVTPSQIICGSNESIDPGDGDQDWAPAFESVFGSLL